MLCVFRRDLRHVCVHISRRTAKHEFSLVIVVVVAVAAESA